MRSIRLHVRVKSATHPQLLGSLYQAHTVAEAKFWLATLMLRKCWFASHSSDRLLTKLILLFFNKLQLKWCCRKSAASPVQGSCKGLATETGPIPADFRKTPIKKKIRESGKNSLWYHRRRKYPEPGTSRDQPTMLRSSLCRHDIFLNTSVYGGNVAADATRQLRGIQLFLRFRPAEPRLAQNPERPLPYAKPILLYGNLVRPHPVIGHCLGKIPEVICRELL